MLVSHDEPHVEYKPVTEAVRFDSGCMPYASVHYPFERSDAFTSGHFPADFIAEGLDQTRGWFWSLTVLGNLLFEKSPFKNVLVNGMVLAEDGKKMSKRLKNYPASARIFDEYGSDALRLYLISSPVVKAEPLRFKEAGLREIISHVLLPLWNSFASFPSRQLFTCPGLAMTWSSLRISL